MLVAGPFTQKSIGSGQTTEISFAGRCEQSSPEMPVKFYEAFTSSLLSGVWATSINEGVDEANQQALNVDCPSGECDFGTYSSLGVCSHCVDYTDAVKEVCKHQSGTTYGETYRTYACDRSVTIAETTLTINNYTCDALNADGTCMWQDPWSMDVGYDSYVGKGSPDGPFMYAPADDPQAAAGALIGGWSILRNLNQTEYEASHCALYYCVRSYDSLVSNSISDSVSRSSWYPTKPGTDEWTDESYNFYMSPEPSAYQDLGMTKPINFTIWESNFNTTTNIPNWLSYSLQGKRIENNFGPNGFGWYINGTGVTVLQSIWDNLAARPTGTVDSLFDYVTRSMTDAFRSTCPHNISAVGTVYNRQTVVDVKWGWLALPAAIVVLAPLLLVLVMLDCRRHNVVHWKNS